MVAVWDTNGLDAADIAALRDEVTALGERLAPRFGRTEVRTRMMRYLPALLGRAERKNSWQLAEEMGEPTPKGVQRLLNGARWDPDLVRDDLRAYVVARLGASEAIGVVDESGFPKRGTKSVGVQKQYCGATRSVTNCQVGVFLAYVSPRGAAFIDRELFLPTSWDHDVVRRAEAGVPVAVDHATKPQLAQRMLQRAWAAGVELSWLVADEVYGDDATFRDALQEAGQAAVLAVSASHVVWTDGSRRTVRALGAEVDAAAWTTYSSGRGSQGERAWEWACHAVAGSAAPGMAHWLLIRRHRTIRTDIAYYRVYGPRATTVAEMARVEGARWAIEAAYEVAKGVVGMDQYEVRTWGAWYRQMTLSMVACAALDVMRAMARDRAAKKGGQPAMTGMP